MSASIRGNSITRFRLRFLLQEFELTGPEVLLGRSPECQITIEDPLVSRKHARIRIGEANASVEDAGSRNGVRVNGELIKQPTQLKDGDRIRLGTQELVFFAVHRPAQTLPRPTGYMKVCGHCNTPYPDGALTCPHCGTSTFSAEEVTISGFIVEPQHTWTLQLLCEVLEKALGLERAQEAERLMRRCADEIDRQNRAAEELEPSRVARIVQLAVQLAKLQASAAWAVWALDTCEVQRCVPQEESVKTFRELRSYLLDTQDLDDRLRTFLSFAATLDASLSDSDRACLGQLAYLLDEGASQPSNVPH